jgi:hypothetical protein
LDQCKKISGFSRPTSPASSGQVGRATAAPAISKFQMRTAAPPRGTDIVEDCLALGACDVVRRVSLGTSAAGRNDAFL